MRRVLLAPAGSPAIGGGHVLRAVALAEALIARGAACTLAANAYGAALARRFGRADLSLLASSSDRAPPLAEAIARARPDVLVLDDYSADAHTVEALGADRPRVAVIDDLADRRHACELLVDPGYGRRPDDYDGLVPSWARVLTGPAHALLRPGFTVEEALPPVRASVARVFVSLGLSDVDGVVARVTRRLRALAPDATVDVALAGDASSVGPLRHAAASDERLRLHLDARDVAALMRGADVAVGAGGTSTWERCALGLPSLAVVVADNQRRVIRALEADGALVACDLRAPDFEAGFDAAWARLLDPATRGRMRARALALCDGQGAARVAEAVLAL